jgi:hypothetical protein
MTGSEAKALREALGLTIPTLAEIMTIRADELEFAEQQDRPLLDDALPSRIYSGLKFRLAQSDNAEIAREAGRRIHQAFIERGCLGGLGALLSFINGGTPR